MNTCKYCGEEIKNTNAPECDRCWEIQWHCIGNPELVAKILAQLTKDALDLPSATVNGKPSQTVSILNDVDLSGTASQ